jgi:transposase-like protein
MNCPNDFTVPEEILEYLSEEGIDALPPIIRTLINEAMLLERQKYVQAEPYERSPQRRSHSNGFKDKTVKTRLGEITFSVPQVRDGQFYPQALEKGLRSERALKIAVAEMYVQGVSTRRVEAVVEKLCGFSISSSQVSRAAAELDEILEKWRTRNLGRFPYLYLDARYEKVRRDGQVRDAAVLIAAGVNEEGKREVLGISVSISEREVHWREFLESLVKRGLCGVKLITSDDHSGLRAARQAVFGGISWQRCQFHLQQNASAYVPKAEMKSEVASDIRSIFNSRDRSEAEVLLKRTADKYRQSASKLSLWMEENIPDGLTVFSFPESHRRLVRTTNGLERVNKEVKRRTRVVGLFPNEESCLRLVSAVLMEISDDWETGKTYLTFSD